MYVTHTKRVRGGLLVSSPSDSTTAIAIHPENLPAEQELQSADLKLLMDTAVNEDDWIDIFRKAKEMALSGGPTGVKAMEFLAKYRWGLPPQMLGLAVEQSKITIVEVVRPEKQVVQAAQVIDNGPAENIDESLRPVEETSEPL